LTQARIRGWAGLLACASLWLPAHAASASATISRASGPFARHALLHPAGHGPVIWRLRESRRSWRRRSGTTFSFELSERATVTFVFRQRIDRVWVPRGALIWSGSVGLNRVRFKGRLHPSGELARGRYLAVLTAANASGESSRVSIAFVILR
jgi:hypothetical protein